MDHHHTVAKSVDSLDDGARDDAVLPDPQAPHQHHAQPPTRVNLSQRASFLGPSAPMNAIVTPSTQEFPHSYSTIIGEDGPLVDEDLDSDDEVNDLGYYYEDGASIHSVSTGGTAANFEAHAIHPTLSRRVPSPNQGSPLAQSPQLQHQQAQPAQPSQLPPTAGISVASFHVGAAPPLPPGFGIRPGPPPPGAPSGTPMTPHGPAPPGQHHVVPAPPPPGSSPAVSFHSSTAPPPPSGLRSRGPGAPRLNVTAPSNPSPLVQQVSPISPTANQSATLRTINRRQKNVILGPSGNVVIKSKVADELLEMCQLTDSEEFTTVRYSAVTCGPNEFSHRGFNLRVANMRRQIEIFIVVTMYNEGFKEFTRTMFALSEAIKYLCTKNLGWGWDQDSWKKVVVCIVADGRSKIDPEVLKVMELMGIYQDGLAQSSINDQAVQAHVFEFTTQVVVDTKLNVFTAQNGVPPMQIIFCLKEKNAKKINSHRWFFNAFAPLLDPRICVLIDVGTRPSKNSLYALWEAFFRNEQIAGACGEIRVDMGTGAKYLKNLFNPLVAAQNFEYKISNLLDKSLESVFGYISVLPGAFSAYRYEALLDDAPGSGPLAKYFHGEQGVEGEVVDNSLFSANLYLAEDRILCFELVSKKNSRWTLHYVSKCYGSTDVPDSVPEFLSQRRRWLNGSLFAGFYALSNIGRIWSSNHRFLRKIGFTLQYLYNAFNQIFSWFILGNFAATFYFLFNSLKDLLRDPYNPANTLPHDLGFKTISILITVAQFSYPVVLVFLFIISFGNRPQAFKHTYTAVMAALAVIGITMMSLLLFRVYNLFSTQTTGLSGGYDVLSGQIQGWASDPVQQTDDPMAYLLENLIWQITDVVKKNVQENLQHGQKLKLAYLVSVGSTFGVMFLASFLQLDFMHMFTCFIQYLMMLPSFINVVTVYALSNLNDVSWGTKGDNIAETLPSVGVTKAQDGSVTASLNVVSDRADRSMHYRLIQNDLRDAASKAKNERFQVSAPRKLTQDDVYRGFRTKLILTYLATNTALFFIAVTVGQSDIYLIILLGGVAILQSVKFLGVLLFIFLKLFTEVLHVNNQGRRKFEREMRAIAQHGGSGGPSTKLSGGGHEHMLQVKLVDEDYLAANADAGKYQEHRVSAFVSS